MKLLFTGATGFLGNNIIPILENYYSITTVGLTNNNDIQIDISKQIPSFTQKYDIVIHAAGKAHSMPKNKLEAQSFFKVNYDGTVNLTKAFDGKGQRPKRFVFISTVGVYGRNDGELIDETYSLEGLLPYQKSKIMAEQFLMDWSAKHNISLTIFRLPLLVGKNPPGNLGAMINAIKKGYYFRIGNGLARRSMVLAEDVAKLIASDQLKAGIFNLTDGVHPSFNQIEDVIADQMNRRIKTIPNSVASIAAKIGDQLPFFPLDSSKLNKIQSTLTFSDSKAREQMNWKPRSVIDHFKI